MTEAARPDQDTPGRPIRIVIADDHPVYRDGLRALAARTPDVEIVAEAATGSEAVAATLGADPDVVLMDVRMPEMSGIEATRAILAERPAARILILTMSEDDDSLFAAMRAGARGYLPKDAVSDEVVRAIRAAAVGELIFGASMAARMQAYFAGSRGRAREPFPELTDREAEVLELVARGVATPEIARRLSISDKTVRNHVASIFTKLRVPDRAGAIIRARDAGIGVDETARDEGRDGERPE